MAINNDGVYLFSGDTDGATTTDEFIAYNGVIAIREGDVIDGVTLTSTAWVRGLAINNLGQAAFAWGPNSGADEYLFLSCDASDLAGSAQLVLATGDTLDFDGNGVADGGEASYGNRYDVFDDELLRALRKAVYAVLARDMDELLAALVAMGLLGLGMAGQAGDAGPRETDIRRVEAQEDVAGGYDDLPLVRLWLGQRQIDGQLPVE